MKMNFTAPCIFGLESLVSDELKKMGAENVAAENGRVFFSGDEYLAARANIRSRFSERIMIVVGSFEAHSFEELFEGTKALPWENFIGEFDEFPVKGHSVNSDLFSISDCQSIIKKAIVERLKTKYNVQWFEETGVKFQIDFSIMKNKIHLMIDTTAQARLSPGCKRSTYQGNSCGSNVRSVASAPVPHSLRPDVRFRNNSYRGRNACAQYSSGA